MLGGGAREPGAARRVREARRRRQRLLGAAFAIALVAGAALVGRRLLEPPSGPPAAPEASPIPPGALPAPPAVARPEPPQPEAEPEPADEPLPPLAESDEFVRERVMRASARPEFAEWIMGEGLVHRFVAAVDAVANGETPRAQLRELAPEGPFRATERGARRFVDPSSHARYDLVAAVFASLDPDVCARLHRGLLPLFESAYGELGRREGPFDQVLARAFRELLRTPVPDGEIELVAMVQSYDYADPALEALSPAQKQLLRMGLSNARSVQAKLRELGGALGLELTAPAAAADR